MDSNSLKMLKFYLNFASENMKIDKSEVTLKQFRTFVKISDRQLKKYGGFTKFKQYLMDYDNKPVIRFTTDKSVTLKEQQKTIRLKSSYLENFVVHDQNLKEIFSKCSIPQNGIMKCVVLPDMHIPEHDEKSVNAVINFINYYKPNSVICLGDFLEMGSVTKWEAKDSRPKRLIPEIKKAREVLERINKAAGPNCKHKVFLTGNHEDWLDQYLVEKIPEFFDGIGELGLELGIGKLLDLNKYGYKLIPLNEIVKLGSAHFIHGYYTSSNHAKKHLDVFGTNIYYGHLHDVQSYSAVHVKGLSEAASLGCLRTLNAPFLKGKPNNWSHSFGIFEYTINGNYTRYTPILIDGKFSFNGKTF